MLFRPFVQLAVAAVLVIPLAGCSSLTQADEITISAEVFGAPPAPAAAPQPIQLPAGGHAAPKTGG